MRTKITSLIAGVITLFSFTALSQTSTNPPPASTSIFEDIGNGLGSVTNWAGNLYLTYAADAPTHVGGGLLALYNVNNNVGAGLGIDWLGEFNLVSADVTLKLPIHPLAGLGFSNIVTTPFVIGGIATPMSGAGKANGNIASIEGAGIEIDFLKWKSVSIGGGYAFVNWTGAGAYSGKHHEVFVSFHKGF
jgi:hypothetical protein